MGEQENIWGELSSEDIELIEWLAEEVVKRNLSVPAVLTLESYKPLSFVGSQLMHVFSPMFGAFFTAGSKKYDQVALMMEDRENVERLLLAIERKQDEYDRKNEK